MFFKIDTKEKFTVISPLQVHLSDNLTEELAATAQNILNGVVKNIILNMEQVKDIEPEAVAKITDLQQSFYENNASFVICNLSPEAEEQIEQLDLLELLNITPTESEAWDIVQMEEIERELLDDDSPAFDSHNEKEE